MIGFAFSSSMLMIPRSLSLSAWLGHIPFASWLIEQLKPQSIVELGTHRGASFLAFCQAVDEQMLTARVFAVDTWEGDEHAGFYGEDVYNELHTYQQRYYAGISEMLRMRFSEALQYFADGSVDLLHIDGLHTYQAVREDFESWLPKLSSRAVVLFHDTCVREREFGVWQYWDEISRQYPSFEFTHTHGLGVLLVGEDRNPELVKLAEVAADGQFAPINHLFDALGRSVKGMEEIERLYVALATERAEIARLTQEQQQTQQRQAELGAHEWQQLQQLCQEQLQGVQQLAQSVQQISQEVEASGVAQRALVEAHVQSLQASIATVAQRLESQEQKLDRVRRPWWGS
ncbi:class I SAM-dependent methyltransferase [Xanthomonas sp. LF02-5]|uniref:class I SAM-dependent methyltransferase n=2 Tax=unclassified Xanthomonas TaxID=2643310 RepID=UPI002A835937|nr:class I SAM-dependent methyltransferase [Xanthomonas sp. LF02-5]MDY4294406.1 class I SAM-dependent methyltransferase [Xanthomonas sp. LF02-5]